VRQQGDNQWRSGRRGRLTASRFGDALAKHPTKRHRQLITDKVDELLGLAMFDNDDPPWFLHGKKLEPEARGMYEWERGVEVYVPEDPIVHPDLDFVACSPDGLVGDDGGIEIKCRASISIWLRESKKGLDSVYRPQVQGNLWVTGREYWDFINYFRDWRAGGDIRRMAVERVYRDDKYIAKLQQACNETWDQIQTELERRKCAS